MKEIYGGTLAQRMAVVGALGMSGPAAERMAAGMDDGMGQAVLSLLRSAVQPAATHTGPGPSLGIPTIMDGE